MEEVRGSIWLTRRAIAATMLLWVKLPIRVYTYKWPKLREQGSWLKRLLRVMMKGMEIEREVYVYTLEENRKTWRSTLLDGWPNHFENRRECWESTNQDLRRSFPARKYPIHGVSIISPQLSLACVHYRLRKAVYQNGGQAKAWKKAPLASEKSYAWHRQE